MQEHLKAPCVAVVVPAYQVSDTIQKVLAGIPDFVDTIIVVDDGSHDDAVQKVKKWKDERVRLVSTRRTWGSERLF